MSLARYEAPMVELGDSAASDEVFWAGVLALAAIAMLTTLGAICLLQGHHLSWGYNSFFGIPYSIWYSCN